MSVATTQHSTNNAEDRDPVLYLLDQCDRFPQDGLKLIDFLDADLRSRPAILFGRFIALRHLALDVFLTPGAPNLGSATPNEILQLMGAAEASYAQQALEQVAQIDAKDPDFIDNLGKDGDTSASSAVDDLCIVVERLQPGKVQEVLGWTKLHYYGSERLGNVPDVFEKSENELIRAAIRTKIRPPQIARSALSYSKGEDDRSRRFVDIYLMEKCFRDMPTMGDANLFCSLRFFSDGEVLIDSSEQAATAVSSGAREGQTLMRGLGYVTPNPFAIVKESADWGEVEFRVMPRHLHDSLMRPALEQVDVLEARKAKGLEASRESLEEGRRRLSVTTGALDKLRGADDVLNERSVIEGLLSAADCRYRAPIGEVQRAEILADFRECDRQSRLLNERYVKNMYVRPQHGQGIGKMLEDMPFMLGTAFVVFVVGWILSFFFDWISAVLPLLVVGVMLFPLGKFGAEKFTQMARLNELNGVEAGLRGKLVSMIDESERNTRAMMERLEEDERSTTEGVQREYTEVLGPLTQSVRNFLANFRKAVSEKEHGSAHLAADWGAELWSAWRPPAESPSVVRIGKLTTKGLAGTLQSTFPKVDFSIDLPALVSFPTGGSSAYSGRQRVAFTDDWRTAGDRGPAARDHPSRKAALHLRRPRGSGTECGRLHAAGGL